MLTRRNFLAASTLAIAGTSVFADVPAQPIIDAHFHVWDRQKLPIPWLKNAGPLMNRDYTPVDYQAALAGLNIRGSIYVEVNVDLPAQFDEASTAALLCKEKSPRVLGAVAGGNPADPGFEAYVDRLQTMSAIRGMRVVLPRKPADNPAVVKGLKRLGKLNLTVDINAGGSQLSELADLLKACGETSFVIDHCGNASPSWLESGSQRKNVDQWRGVMRQLAACPNAACKISGVAENGTPANDESVRAISRECLDLFGADRVLFATNWPVCLKATTPAKWYAIVSDLMRSSSSSDRQKLFAQNAERWYRL